jgi:hypothetical protein
MTTVRKLAFCVLLLAALHWVGSDQASACAGGGCGSGTGTGVGADNSTSTQCNCHWTFSNGWECYNNCHVAYCGNGGTWTAPCTCNFAGQTWQGTEHFSQECPGAQGQGNGCGAAGCDDSICRVDSICYC